MPPQARSGASCPSVRSSSSACWAASRTPRCAPRTRSSAAPARRYARQRYYYHNPRLNLPPLQLGVTVIPHLVLRIPGTVPGVPGSAKRRFSNFKPALALCGCQAHALPCRAPRRGRPAPAHHPPADRGSPGPLGSAAGQVIIGGSEVLTPNKYLERMTCEGERRTARAPS